MARVSPFLADFFCSQVDFILGQFDCGGGVGGVVSMQYMGMEGVSKSCGVVGRTKRANNCCFPLLFLSHAIFGTDF